MSSPNIKFQTLIRKFRNGMKETLDKKKIIEDYSYQLESEEILTTSDIFHEKKAVLFNYDINDVVNIFKEENKHVKSEGIPIHKSNKFTQDDFHMQDFNPPNDMLFSFSPNINAPDEARMLMIEKARPLINEKADYYLGEDGYLQNIYGIEYCDYEWIIMMYFINRLYANFATCDKIKIKSLHIHSLPGSNLSAIHHFLYNSKVNTVYQNIEWQWLATVNNTIYDEYNIRRDLKIKYSKNLLSIFDSDTHYPNNIKFIINESLNRMDGKMNFLCIDAVNDDIRNYVAYAMFFIKLLENNSLVYIQLLNPKEWTLSTINGLILYSLLFQELYIFTFKFDNIRRTVLICKNKKRISAESIYKKLMTLLLDNVLPQYNLFSIEFFKHDKIKDLLKKIIDIKTNEIEVVPIVLSDVMYEIDKVLELNVNMFL